MFKNDLELNCQPWKNHPYCIPTFQIHHMDYPDQDFTKLKYSEALAPIIWRGQSHFDPYTDFASTWLYPVAFHHCIRNLENSLTLKYSELLASHYSDLRSEGYLYPCISWVALDSRILSRWGQPTHMAHNDLHSINVIVP